MPKTPKSKKRKVKLKPEQRKKKAKRLKFDDEETDKRVEGENVETERNEVEEVEEDGGEDLEKMLEEHADKNNLSAINVKSILHHVITDKRVLELVQKVIAEKEREQSEETDTNLEFEPKMTRSKYRQKNLEDPISQLTKSPLKNKRPVSTFTDLEFPESSSDEEYSPDEDEEDEDTESCLSAQSDLASPYKPATPDTMVSDSFQDIAADISSPSVSRPLTRHRSQEMIFKKPDNTTCGRTPDKFEDDLIAKRTRSLLPLKDKELPYYDIELPDFSPDLYDQIKLDDLDDDQIAFQKFLQSLANEEDNDIMTEDDDFEYDFMAENINNVEEKEEYRNDRAVRIPKKEVSDLFVELLNECSKNEDDDALWDARGLLLDIDDDTSKVEVLFTDEQRTQLSKQMDQHVQLLVQVYLLSREEPSLQEEATLCRQFINELEVFCDRSQSVHPIMALGGTMPALSMFDVPGIQEAVRIINKPFTVKRPRSPRKQPTLGKDIKEGGKQGKDSKWKAPRITLPPISSTNQAIMADSLLFKDAILLPRCGFMDKELLGVKVSSSLRVKFTETEDNLLALGMHQFQRNWKLIQNHLLPVKTPKQLHIRCKNLLSSRSSNNIVKYLRDSKTLWALPTEIKIISEADNSRRISKTIEPDWLINYRQKLKPQKKPVPPTPSPQKPPPWKLSPWKPCASKTEHPVAKSTHETVTLNEYVTKESSPKQTELKENTVESQSLSDHKRDHELEAAVPKHGDQQKDQTLITSPTKEPKELATIEQNQNIAGTVDEIISINSSKPPDRNESIQELKSEANSPDENPSKFIVDHVSNEDSQPSPCFDIDDETAPFTPTSPDDKDDCMQGTLQSSPVPSESTVEKTSKFSPVPSTAKSKPGRDKSSNVATLSQNATKKTIQSLPALPPDPKEQTRAQALANGYLAKVKKCLQDDQEQYELFLGTLVASSTHQWTPAQLYKQMEMVLSDYPDLIEDFIAFLEPEQAFEAGVLMENLEFIKARNFLRRLEVHFQKNRSHFQKIVEVFSTWSTGDKAPLELREKVIPLLRGQQHLVDEFQSFFDNLKPPPCCEEDFEEIEIGSGSDPEMDDFEEVVIPDMIEHRKPKGKLKVKQTTTTASKASTANKQKLTPKPVTRTKKTDKKRSVLSKKSPQSVESVSRDGLSEGEEDASYKKVTDDTNNPSRHIKQERPESDELDQNPSSVKTEGSISDGPLSVSSSFHNDTSNDSVRQEDQEDTPKPRWSRTTSNDANDDDDSDNSDNNDESAYDDACDDTEDGTEFQATLSAQNHQLDQDGQLVVLWTRDDDRTILSICHHQGASQETFDLLATKLDGKTADEIKSRFEELMKLIEADNTRQGSSSEEEDDEDDSDGSDSETDS